MLRQRWIRGAIFCVGQILSESISSPPISHPGIKIMYKLAGVLCRVATVLLYVTYLPVAVYYVILIILYLYGIIYSLDDNLSLYML